ncbi:Conjugal transfer protein TrbG/VirB9/CagX [Paraburkholderia piptadeniae]|uniref:Conjugal transfer protein TrbG/VirB9/CagX n=1 Tax=Paraburkholderia piptadeniae TaxID=1701573 RepID=A0A1N7STY5_9BURK|nr:TrbG/VirB9 family P-type conjugative transfer protein [Paraburkholderia piptadeniae]SIT50778.1 Conjugal transfer protein TrbG/VirB9/CagX [Paraburkholderia piptadeniae]
MTVYPLLARTAIALAVTAGVVATSPSALALDTPRSCGADPHVQCASYDPDQVYRVATMPGRAVMIQFEPGEHIVDHGAGIGDAKAWHMAMNDSGALLKPGAIQPETNLVLVTNRRTYTLSLADVSASQPATWVLRFDYPDTRARASAALLRRQQAVSAALAGGAAKVPLAMAPAAASMTVAANTPATPTAPATAGGTVPQSQKSVAGNSANMQYMMRGDRALAPTALWDDGRFTYFRYATARDLPTIFTKLPDGGEATVNFHMEGDTVVVHEVSRDFVIRYGQSVLGIRNDGYAPDGHYNGPGSSLPGTARLPRDHVGSGSANAGD